MRRPSQPFTFAIVADSHVRLDEGEPQVEYPSNRLVNGRNRYVIRRLNELKPDFVVHLGDFVHVIPGQPDFERAMRLAVDIFQELEMPLHPLPGNHDVGDKPDVSVPAPSVTPGSDAFFEPQWGATFRSFDHKGCHFVLINAPLLNAGFELEEAQRIWLESDLAANERRQKPLFLFSHYPLYLAEPDEPSHYDNIDSPAREWLLDLIEKYRPEALFAGHVHNFFYNRYRKTDLVVLPAVSFIRPGFSDLFDVPPVTEFGREDGSKLGFALVHVHQWGHRLQLVRTGGAALADGEPLVSAPAPSWKLTRPHPRLGLFLRRNWAEALLMATANLDEFVRKRARNDYWLWGALELGVGHLRLPLADLRDSKTRHRAAALNHLGLKLTFFSAGVPNAEVEMLLAKNHHLIEAWELIVPDKKVQQAVRRVRDFETHPPVPLLLCPLKMPDMEDPDPFAADFDHFPEYGLGTDDPDRLERQLNLEGVATAVSGVIFRIPVAPGAAGQIDVVSRLARRHGVRPVVHGRLPRLSEGYAFTDDRLISNGVAEAAAAVACSRSLLLFLDTLEDHDRGYFPRHGLMDRRYRPRSSYDVLLRLGVLMAELGPFRKMRPLTADEGWRLFELTRGNGRRCALIIEDQPAGSRQVEIEWGAGSESQSGTVRWHDLFGGEAASTAWRLAGVPGRIIIECPIPGDNGRYPGLLDFDQV